ncbi:MAG: NAD-binding protein [Anaerolineae bacterium]|nr:NAD-binding protein [Anaerolineae bacterium]
MKKTLQRYLKASLRDVRVLVREFRASLLLFSGVILMGGLILRTSYVWPDTGQQLSYAEAVYAAFTLIFLETYLRFPDVWYLQILFLVIPIIGLSLIANGVIRFGVMLFNKQARREEWQVALASTYSGHVVVCGLGRDGYRVVEQLLKFGEEAVGIERNEKGQFLDPIRNLGVPVIISDARRPGALSKAGVERAAAIVICTEDDLVNLSIALEARELNPNIRVVMRMFDAELAQKMEKVFGIHAAFSTSALAAPALAAAATHTDVIHSFYVDDTLLNVSEIVVQPCSPLVGYEIAAVEREFETSVILYKGQQEVDLHPAPHIRLQAGDKIVVFASLKTLNRLHRCNRASSP